MVTRSFFILIFLSALVAVLDAFEVREKRDLGTPTAEECMKPPMSKFGHECCRLPKERIWGDIRPSLNACFKKMKQEAKLPDEGPERNPPEPSDAMTPTEGPSEGGVFSNTSPLPPGDRPGRRPHGKKPFAERLKDLFSTVYKEIKNTINSIWKSVVIITDHFRRHGNDSCFMECVFQDQGFLTDKMLNKAALLERLDKTLGQNEPWHKAAVTGLEICYQSLMETPSNKTCQSGSEEIFRCVFKEIFFNCPNWTQSEYCGSLKQFYEKCPNGPPPEITDNHSTSPAPPEAAEDSTDASASTETAQTE